MRGAWWILLFCAVAFALALIGLVVGSLSIPLDQVWQAMLGHEESTSGTVVREVRVPHVLTAATAGAGLALSGLLMQTIFRNPLAGPGVLGLSSGSSLGVALVLLAAPITSALPIPKDLLMILASVIGALSVLVMIVLADRRVGHGVTLLIIGLMVGYICSAVISVLQSSSAAGALKGYVLWGMGSFAAVDASRIPWLLVPVITGCAAGLTLVKSLNALLLGDEQARTLGVNVHRVRRQGLWITGLLAGSITAFCGPVGFIGLATPHVARAFIRTSDHRVLAPACVALGAALALGCDLIVRSLSTDIQLPLNSVTSLLGAPVVLWVIWSGRRWSQHTHN